MREILLFCSSRVAVVGGEWLIDHTHPACRSTMSLLELGSIQWFLMHFEKAGTDTSLRLDAVLLLKSTMLVVDEALNERIRGNKSPISSRTALLTKRRNHGEEQVWRSISHVATIITIPWSRMDILWPKKKYATWREINEPMHSNV